MHKLLPILSLLILSACPAADDTGLVDDTGTPSEGDAFTLNLTLGWPDVGSGPLEGATVALDDGAGTRSEAVSGSDGVVNFEVDWSQGPVMVTVDTGVPGVALYTWAGLTEADSGRQFEFFDSATLDDQVELYGTVADRSEDSWLWVGAQGGAGSSTETFNESWSVEVMPDTDVELLAFEYRQLTDDLGPQEFAHEILNWTLLPMDGVSADTELDLVLTGDQTPLSFETRWLLPDDPADPLYGESVQSWTTVFEQHGGQVGNICGLPTRTDISDDGAAFEGDYSYLPSSTAEGVLTVQQLYTGGTLSVQVVPGTADDWDHEPQMMPIPTDVQVDGNDAGTWSASVAEPGVEASLELWMMDQGNQLVWVAYGEGLELALPAPPSSVTVEELVGDVAFQLPILAHRVSDVEYGYSAEGYVVP